MGEGGGVFGFSLVFALGFFFHYCLEKFHYCFGEDVEVNNNNKGGNDGTFTLPTRLSFHVISKGI